VLKCAALLRRKCSCLQRQCSPIRATRTAEIQDRVGGNFGQKLTREWMKAAGSGPVLPLQCKVRPHLFGHY
jgi:hypothetical protein